MMQHFYYNIDGFFADEREASQDFQIYADMVKKYDSGAHFVEVGSFKGRSACLMAVEIHNSGKDIKFDCVDTWEGSEEHQHLPEVVRGELYEIFLKNIAPVSEYIRPIRLKSKDAARIYKDESLDFVFIDADHSYDGVIKDLIAWTPKVKKGGTIAGHDYGAGEQFVDEAVHDFFEPWDIKLRNNIWLVER